jgi:hypothetical protein
MKMKMTMMMALILLAVAGCRQESEQQVSFLGPDGKASLVAVLKSGVTDQEVNRFLEDTVVFGRINESSSPNRPGVGAIVSGNVQGHTAYSIKFFPSATPEQRDTVTKAMKASPYVLKVFADIDPDAIMLDEPPGQRLTS